MPEFTTDLAAQEQIEKVPLAEDRFHIAAENIENEKIPEEMKGVAIQKRRGQELPRVRFVNTSIADRQIIRNEAGLKRVQEKLGYKCGDVQREDRAQNDRSAGPRRPRKK